MIEENTPPEVKDPAAILAKNRELLAKNKALQTELEATRGTLEATKAASDTWQAKWHQSAVIEPFEAALKDACAVPSKYLRAELLERGIVKMKTDDEGIDRPVFYAGTEPVTPANIYQFLCDMNDPVLNTMLRSSGRFVSGSGAGSARGDSLPRPRPQEPATTKTPPPSYGLR